MPPCHPNACEKLDASVIFCSKLTQHMVECHILMRTMQHEYAREIGDRTTEQEHDAAN